MNSDTDDKAVTTAPKNDKGERNDNLNENNNNNNNSNLDDGLFGAPDDFGWSKNDKADNIGILYDNEGDASLKDVARDVYKTYPLRCSESIDAIAQHRARLSLYILTRVPSHYMKYLLSLSMEQLVTMAEYYQMWYNVRLGRQEQSSDVVPMFNFFRKFQDEDMEKLKQLGQDKLVANQPKNHMKNNDNNNMNNNNNNMNMSNNKNNNDEDIEKIQTQINVQENLDKLRNIVRDYNNGGTKERLSAELAQLIANGGVVADMARGIWTKHLTGDQPPRKKARISKYGRDRNVRIIFLTI